jgi:hypothetical protein
MRELTPPNLQKCWTCGKIEEYEGEHYVGQCPYALAMCPHDDTTDEEVICDDCYTNKVQDI